MSRYVLYLKILALEDKRYTKKELQCNRPREEVHTGGHGSLSFKDVEQSAG